MSCNSDLLKAMKECLRILESSRSAQDDLVTSDLKEALRKRIAEVELQSLYLSCSSESFPSCLCTLLTCMSNKPTQRSLCLSVFA
jgi:hypothetical protein